MKAVFFWLGVGRIFTVSVKAEICFKPERSRLEEMVVDFRPFAALIKTMHIIWQAQPTAKTPIYIQKKAR